MLNQMTMDRVLLGQTIAAWLTAAALGLGILLAVLLARAVLRRRFAGLYQRRQKEIYAFLLAAAGRTYFLLVLLVSVYIGSRPLSLSDSLNLWLRSIAVIALLLQLGFWLSEVINYAANRYQKTSEQDPSRLTTIRAMRFIGRLLLFAIIGLLVLDNVPGVEITALVASLGIGGIAVALAVQNVLSDLFASLSIVLDKPFVVGDFIIVDDYLGSVENIGLKTTRIRSLSGEQLIFSNNDLLKSRIRNYKRMVERRVVFSFGVVYQTPYHKMQQIPEMVRDIVTSIDKTRFDRAHFSAYGDFALNFEVVYYVLEADYNRYMDIQQAINMELLRRFEAEKIYFAYPTRTIFLEGSAQSHQIQ